MRSDLNSYNRSRSRNRWLCLLLACWITQAWSHEFWIEPICYRLEPDMPLQAHIKVGQHFKGDSYPYIPANTGLFQIRSGGVTRDVGSTIGDMPAIDEQPQTTGLIIIAHVTNTLFLTYDTRRKFAESLRYEGLEWVLDEHARRNLPAAGFSEAYQRFAKSLVQSGDTGGADELLGLEFEWLIENNPYSTPDGELLQARLFWRGAPLMNWQARLFVRRGGRVSETRLVTDADGRVDLSLEPGSEVLLNAVQMTPASPELQRASEAVWKSYWASTTFAVPEAQ